MSGVYLYAIIDQADTVPVITKAGIEDAEVYTIAYKDIAAVVSDISGELTVTDEMVWRHEAIVEQLMVSYALLPIQLNTRLRDQTALANVMQQGYCDFVRDLNRVRGSVELAVRVFWEAKSDGRQDDETLDAPHPSMTGEGAGRRYMMARFHKERGDQDIRQRANRLREKIHAELGPLAAQGDLKILRTSNQLMMGSYLVRFDRIGDFSERLVALGAEHPEFHFTCTGPWPAYSFVETRIT